MSDPAIPPADGAGPDAFEPSPEAVARITRHLLGEDIRNVRAAIESFPNGHVFPEGTDTEARLRAARAAIEALPSVATQHSCWDNHDGPDGGHADGSPCRDRVLWDGIDRAAVLAALDAALASPPSQPSDGPEGFMCPCGDVFPDAAAFHEHYLSIEIGGVPEGDAVAALTEDALARSLHEHRSHPLPGACDYCRQDAHVLFGIADVRGYRLSPDRAGARR